jgi:chemotaxis protein histidine kinase CheA
MTPKADAERLAVLDPDGIFPARLAADRAALLGYYRHVWELEPEAREAQLKLIATLAHRLGGAAGTFGFGAVSDAALALEMRIVDCESNETPAQHAAIRQGIDALFSALDEACATTNDEPQKSGSGQVEIRK